jgi:tRNA nucleotidyltransferase (CCA-adding enzyme)
VKRAGEDAVRRALPEASRDLVARLGEAAEARGWGVLLVGGPVRDFLLGRGVRDVDLLVEPPDAPADPVAAMGELVAEAAPAGARVVTHPRFGTAKVDLDGGAVDLAMTRAETYERPGALPTVRPGTLEEDLRRRDFRVNALAVPLNPTARRGRAALVDPGGGVDDLRAGILRLFHRRSFHDDPTRALRAARLGPRLGMRLGRGARSALRDAVRDGAFGAVSGERYRAELTRLFDDAHLGLDPARALRLLDEWHVLQAIEPGLGLPRGAAAALRRLGRTVAAPPRGLEAARPWLAGLMVWLGGVEAGVRRRTLERLAVRGDAAERIRAFPKARATWLRALARHRGRGEAFRILRAVADEELLALAAVAEVPPRRRILRFAGEDRRVRLPVDGDDLVALGLRGPQVGRALERIRVAVLDRAVRTREEALALAAEMAGLDRAPRRRRSRR